MTSDDLVMRLRDGGICRSDIGCADDICAEAADRLEQIRELYLDYVDLAEDRAARIKKLEAALGHIYAWYPISVTQPRQTIDEIREFARAAMEKKNEQ
jgi:hypothetical protein